ncbi:hypothetical protein BJ878DRAFT_420995 [Calycina marina]|uniref:PHD-type domain-containing protein n=1 Tax=Calycina marina TaxID=1763456 RepID=A0A9P7Z3D6_9HELO|nr:hypothetical protein BJ878DRAFT_420995 [Calycina marina]
MGPSDVSKASTPVPNASSTATNASPPKYVPQFSAATEMILKRIQSGASASNLSSFGVPSTGVLPSGYEDMRRSVMMGMKTSMNMDIPSTPVNKGGRRNGVRGTSVGSASASASKSGTPGASRTGRKNGTPAKRAKKPRAKVGQKRKRKQESSDEESEVEEEDSDIMSKLGGDSDSDASGSIQDFPKITQSGRAVNKPQQFVPEIRETSARKRGPSKKSQEMALCKRCGRGHSPDNNMIVFCDGCNGGWHQMCHDPPVSNEAVKDEDAPWFCLDCTQKRAKKSAPKAPTPTPAPAAPAPAPAPKRAYFSTLSPYNLVSLLMQATAIHPDLPLFPSQFPGIQAQPVYISPFSRPPPPQGPPMKPAQSAQLYNYVPGQSTGPHAHPNLFSRAEANPNAQMNFIRKIAPGASSAKNTPKTSHNNSLAARNGKGIKTTLPTLQVQGVAINGDMDSRESTPASPPYPKPGNGLMARLGPDDEDSEWLVDDGDFEAFSHTVYDNN